MRHPVIERVVNELIEYLDNCVDFDFVDECIQRVANNEPFEDVESLGE